jgi:hypothetical protein
VINSHLKFKSNSETEKRGIIENSSKLKKLIEKVFHLFFFVSLYFLLETLLEIGCGWSFTFYRELFWSGRIEIRRRSEKKEMKNHWQIENITRFLFFC